MAKAINMCLKKGDIMHIMQIMVSLIFSKEKIGMKITSAGIEDLGN